jgi:aryl-alcohol dehydrogenase-like predicted oxidoreductase
MKSLEIKNKIALGTVQFGLDYGIANNSGQVSISEIRNILKYAKMNSIDTLDTAIGYGDSEERLGAVGVSQWNVVTKLPALTDQIKDVKTWVREAVEQSMIRLQVDQLSGMLLHRPNDLLNKHGDDIYMALEELKFDGLVNKIGASVYVPDELDSLFSRYKLDIVQAPFNIFDRRLKESGWLDRLSNQGTEIHVRSVFLQGLLLMSDKNRPDQFRRWESLWCSWDDWLSEAKLSPLQACLWYVLSEMQINRVIVGVDNVEHFKEILNATKEISADIPKHLYCNDLDLINPARWNIQ